MAEPKSMNVKRDDRQYEKYKEFMQRAQRQDSTRAQLIDVVTLANRAGCYDAADTILYRLIKND